MHPRWCWGQKMNFITVSNIFCQCRVCLFASSEVCLIHSVLGCYGVAPARVSKDWKCARCKANALTEVHLNLTYSGPKNIWTLTEIVHPEILCSFTHLRVRHLYGFLWRFHQLDFFAFPYNESRQCFAWTVYFYFKRRLFLMFLVSAWSLPVVS